MRSKNERFSEGEPREGRKVSPSPAQVWEMSPLTRSGVRDEPPRLDACDKKRLVTTVTPLSGVLRVFNSIYDSHTDSVQ